MSSRKVKSLGEASRAVICLPFEQNYSPPMRVVIISHGHPASLIEPIKRLVRELDPDLAIVESKTMAEHIGVPLYQYRPTALVSGLFGLLGFLLASVGLYGVMTYSIAQRTRKIGIRAALGAQKRDILRMVMTEGVKVVSVGVAGGEGGPNDRAGSASETAGRQGRVSQNHLKLSFAVIPLEPIGRGLLFHLWWGGGTGICGVHRHVCLV